MSKKNRTKWTADFRMDPQNRLCNRFDDRSIAEYPLPDEEDMGFRVIDNCAEENIR